MADGLHIVIDTKEQRPWTFPMWVECDVHGLNTGDYALFEDCEFIAGRDSAQVRFSIERKSAEDFAGTIATGWPRFCRELKRMDELFPANIIIVEADFENFCFRNALDGAIIPPDHEHCRVSPQFVMKRIAQLTMRNTTVLFGGNADLAAALALRILIERKNNLNEQTKKLQRIEREKAKCK